MARAGWKWLALAGLAACAPPVGEESEAVPVSSPPVQAAQVVAEEAPRQDPVLDSAQALEDARALVDDAWAALAAADLDAAREIAREAIEMLLALSELEADEAWIALLHVAGNVARLAQDTPTARAAWEKVHDVRSRTLPGDHMDLLLVRRNLANTMFSMGDLPGARALQELVLEAFERTRPEDHPDLLGVRLNLANTMRAMGDLPGARALQELVLEARERTLPEDHSYLFAARGNLANTMREMGDLPGARALQERVLEALERTLSEDHPDLLVAQGNLAGTMYMMGDLVGARVLQKRSLEAYERTLPQDHAHLLLARLSLAETIKAMGDLPGARALEERVLEAQERTLPQDHLHTLVARLNLAATIKAMGDLSGARALEERVLAVRARTLPEDHPDLLLARGNLAQTMAEMGDLAGARTLVAELVSGMRRRAVAALALSPREAREAVGTDTHWLSQALSSSEGAEALDRSGLFELVETRRMVATTAVQATRLAEADEELAPLAREAAEARARLNDLVAGAAREEYSEAAFGVELERLSALRDRAERTIRGALSERGIVADALSAPALASALPQGSAAVGFLRYARWRQGATTSRLEVGEDHLLAHVLSPDGELSRVELGTAAEIEHAVAAWRAAVGSPLTTRGVGLTGSLGDPPAEIAAGEELRRLLLEPLLEATGEEARTLLVCPDDMAFLVPLDALPLEGDRVGDRFRIVVEPFFSPFLQSTEPPEGETTFVALGGIDYGAEVDTSVVVLADRSPPVEASLRSGSERLVGELPGSRAEVVAIAGLFEKAFDRHPLPWMGDGASKAALVENAPNARYLHLATHGWFAPEAVKSILDESPAEQRAWQRLGLEERIIGFAPMTLCGLALAGANLGRDSLGRVPGILTAEELCSLDLSNCELAVLSACETNVGIRRAGQGIQSLQAALFAAGARTSITSLWKVDDAATRKLMELFYTYLWIEKLPKAEALWRAKTDLRSAGHPVRDWAAWVLSGDPR